MEYLPQLYNLQTIDIYVYYDQPLLFSAQDPFGQKYLVVLAEETDTGEIWLCAEISDEVLDKINSGNVAFYSVFADPKNDSYSIFLEFNTGNYKIEKLDKVNVDWLPEPGAKV